MCTLLRHKQKDSLQIKWPLNSFNALTNQNLLAWRADCKRSSSLACASLICTSKIQRCESFIIKWNVNLTLLRALMEVIKLREFILSLLQNSQSNRSRSSGACKDNTRSNSFTGLSTCTTHRLLGQELRWATEWGTWTCRLGWCRHSAWCPCPGSLCWDWSWGWGQRSCPVAAWAGPLAGYPGGAGTGCSAAAGQIAGTWALVAASEPLSGSMTSAADYHGEMPAPVQCITVIQGDLESMHTRIASIWCFFALSWKSQ